MASPSSIDLRLGRWQDVLAGVGKVGAVITDPPYSARTHDGNKSLPEGRRAIDYAAWSTADVSEFVSAWAPRCWGWVVAMTDSELIDAWRQAYRAAGLYDFAPVPVLQHRPRLTGDGPGSGAVYMMVARPKRKDMLSWGSLPCWYEAPVERGARIGGKPVGLMRAIVRDYTMPIDLVCDPCAGMGSTLLAAASEGRPSIGAEVDADTYAQAVARLSAGFTPPLFNEDNRGIANA